MNKSVFGMTYRLGSSLKNLQIKKVFYNPAGCLIVTQQDLLLFFSCVLYPQQITKPCPPGSGLFCFSFGVGQGQAVAPLLQPGKGQLPCGVAFVAQGVHIN